MMNSVLRILLVLVLVLGAGVADARVISYAPYTDAVALPALGHRLNRHFLLIERASGTTGGSSFGFGQAILYDTTNAREPRVVFPADRTNANFWVAAVRENAARVPTILLQTDYNFEGQNPSRRPIFVLSTDGGESWKRVAMPENVRNVVQQIYRLVPDVGGPYARSRYSPVRIGTDSWPFVVATEGGVIAVNANGTTRSAIPTGPNYFPALVGSDITGRFQIVRTAADTLAVADLEGGVGFGLGILSSATNTMAIEGWMAPDGSVYLELNNSSASGPRGAQLKIVRNGTVETLAPFGTGDYFPPGFGSSSAGRTMFAIPAADYNGAWIVERGPSEPTVLLHHTPGGVVVKQWEDVTRPEVEALHAGNSGRTLLVQVHRPRAQADQRLFQDPALAVWTAGEPAPRVYDELFMNEQPTKAFIHVDVDKLKEGAPFVFDSGVTGPPPPQVIISPFNPGGGGDVIQEWGVVRASLRQQLVLPAIGRTAGAYGSNWVSDVIIQNPFDEPQRVQIMYMPNGVDPRVTLLFNQANFTLAAREIRLVEDVLKTLFNLEQGSGALYLTPDVGVTATSRTYTRAEAGSYGFNMNAIDVYAAVGPRFPVSFSGAFPGAQYRTNLILTDTSGASTQAALQASGSSGLMGADNVALSTPHGGQMQYNGIGHSLGLFPAETGGLIVTPTRGTLIASLFTVDNKTNDPTYFPPDLPAPVVRTIPIIGHVDGANNSQFRSDLHLFNPATAPRTVTLQMKMWDSPQTQTLTLTLLPREARVIRDVLFTAFGRSGAARLRYSSAQDPLGVRVTSRTYSVDGDGGTYGFLMPPLNNFQLAGPGDTLELLGTMIDDRFRTNIGIVDLAAFPTSSATQVMIEILDDRHRVIDSFLTSVTSAGGMQINDVFRARGLSKRGPMPVLIRLTPAAGVIGAYATMTDNGTNDSTYVGANLAGKG